MEIIIVVWLMAMGVKAVAEELATGRSRPAASPAGGGPRLPKYGVFDRMADSYRDSMRRSTEEMIRRRDARDAERRANPQAKVSRWGQAEDRLVARWEKRQPAATQATTFTDPPKTPAVPAPAPPADPPTGDGPTAPVIPIDRRKLRPVPPPTDDAPAVSGPEPAGGQPAQPAPTTTSSKGAPPMSGAGEVVNFETHIAELEEARKKINEGIDLTKAALDAQETAKARIDDVQALYGPVAAATQTRVDHLQAAGVDQETTSHAADAADQLRPGTVERYYDSAESLVAELRALLAKLEAAKASTEAELASAKAKYADAQDTVNSNLGGNASYLNNGGGSASTTATSEASAQPEPAGATR